MMTGYDDYGFMSRYIKVRLGFGSDWFLPG